MTDKPLKSSHPSELKELQASRSSNYGSFSDVSKKVEEVMNSLRYHNQNINGVSTYPSGFETALFYMVSKLVRLSATPLHEDSALDLSSYANLWLEIIRTEYKDESK